MFGIMFPLNVLLCIFLAFISCSNAASIKRATISHHPVVLIVSYDGFRHDYMDRVNVTPWLNALKNSGISVPYMEPVFPTSTFPNHHSIATGLYTESHGVVDNEFFDPLVNRTLSGFTDDPGFWNYDGNVLPLWIRNEMAGEGRVSGCYMWPGSSEPYGSQDNLLPTYNLKYNGSIPWEDRVDTVVSWITNETAPANLIFMYYNQPDSDGHAYGPNSPETLAQVENADNRTGYLINKLIDAGIFEQVNLIVLSDHGMKEVTMERVIHLNNLIDSDALIEAKYGSSPVLQLVPRAGRGDELYTTLKELSNNHTFNIWKKEEMRDPLYYNASRRITDFVVVADSGYAFDDFNRTTNMTREYGMHGYSNTDPAMRPIFIARGPEFKSGETFPPFKNVDLVPLLSTILGIPEPPNNGSLDRVVDMLKPHVLEQSSSG